MGIRKLLFGSAVLISAAGACDLNKTGNQLAAPQVMVATLLSTPAVTLGPDAIAGFDASFPDGGFTVDGGLPFDAGLLDGGFPSTITIPPQAAATMFFGTRQSASLDVEPKGVDGAMATVQAGTGPALPMIDMMGGNFRLTSADDAGFTYAENTPYVFTANWNGQAYKALIDSSPLAETIAEFHPDAGYIDQPVGADFVFFRPDPPSGQKRNLGFVVVVPVDRNGNQGSPTYTNVPKTPLGFLKLIVNPVDWTTTKVTVPGAMAFPDADKNYVILFQSAKLGGPQSDNLFSGSAILAGTADIGVVKTH